MKTRIKAILLAFTSFFLSSCSNNTTKTPDLNENPPADNDVTHEVSPNISKNRVYNEDKPDGSIIELPETLENDTLQENSPISTFSTKVYTKTADRVKNLDIVCKKISGTVIEPNEEFSYNKTCGPYNKENGFGKATVFIGGKEVQEYGGGVCQLSSTLYNAIKNLDVDIIERHNHSNEVYYVPKNQDATVSYGNLDFRFKNSNSYPIRIEATSDKNNVTVSIYKV